MTPDSFDHIIRKRLYEAESEVPDHLWEQVSMRIAPAKKNKRWLIFLILGLLVFSTVTASLYFGEKSIPEEHDLSSQPSLVDDRSESLSEGNKAEGIQNNTEESPRDNPVSTEDHSFRAEQQSPVLSDESKFLKGNPAVKAPVQSFSLENPVETSASLHSGSKNPDVPGLSIQTLLPLSSRSGLDLTTGNPRIDICPAFTIDKRPLSPFIEFSIGAGAPFRSMSAIDEEWNSYLQDRLDSETPKVTLDLKLLGGLHLGQSWLVKAGLGLNQVRETFDFIDESASRTITSIITDTVFSGGTVIITRDTSVVTEYGQRVKRSNNTYTRFDLPLLAGYQLDFGKHRLEFSAGVAINLIFWQKGNILSTEGDISDLSSTSFRTRAGIDILGNAAYIIPLTNRDALSLQISYRHALQSMTRPDYPIQQKYLQLNLGIALKHYF